MAGPRGAAVVQVRIASRRRYPTQIRCFSALRNNMETVNAKTAITLICLGFILLGVSIPLYLGKVKMNYFYGFRIRKAFESEENWYEINSYGAKALMRWSLVIMVIGILCPRLRSSGLPWLTPSRLRKVAPEKPKRPGSTLDTSPKYVENGSYLRTPNAPDHLFRRGGCHTEFGSELGLDDERSCTSQQRCMISKARGGTSATWPK
jgi:hypothetical protein